MTTPRSGHEPGRRRPGPLPAPRRQSLAAGAAVPPVAAPPAQPGDAPPGRRKTHIGVSTYSYWQFNRPAYRDVGTCIDLAAEAGFDGVEILLRQIGETPDA